MRDSRPTALKTGFLLSSKRGRGGDSDELWTCKTVTGILGEVILVTEGRL